MKNTLVFTIAMALAPVAFAQTTSPGINILQQRWADSPHYLSGQTLSPTATASPAMGTGMVQTPQQAMLQQQAQQQAQQQQSAEQDGSQTAQAQDEARPPVDDTQTKALLWMNDPTQDLRQSGGKLERPLARGFANSSAPQDQRRLDEWRRQLLNVGVPQSKIEFEARRLNREDFELWASRFVWWENDEHPNAVDVGRAE